MINPGPRHRNIVQGLAMRLDENIECRTDAFVRFHTWNVFGAVFLSKWLIKAKWDKP